MSRQFELNCPDAICCSSSVGLGLFFAYCNFQLQPLMNSFHKVRDTERNIYFNHPSCYGCMMCLYWW